MERVIDPSLVLYLPLCEEDGNPFISGDAYGHPSTVTGALWKSCGRYFDGEDDYITVGNAPSSVKDCQQGTLLVWLDTTSSGVFFAMSKASANFPQYRIFFSLEPTYNYIRYYVCRTTSNETIIRTANGTWDDAAGWHFIGFSYDGVTSRGIVDGSVLSTTSSDGNFYWLGDIQQVDTVTVGAEIRSGSPANNLNGTIGEILLYNRALSEQEIRRNYLATKWRYI